MAAGCGHEGCWRSIIPCPRIAHMPSSADSLSQLLRASWQLFWEKKRPIIVGTALFGTLVALVGAVSYGRAERHVWDTMQRLGVDQREMLEMQRMLRSGDEEAVEEIMQALESTTEPLEQMTDEERDAFFAAEGMRMMRSLLPLIGVGMLWWALMALLATGYFTFLALGSSNDPVALLQLALGKALSLLGVGVWAMLRSFVWIPILGIIPALILGPRFAWILILGIVPAVILGPRFACSTVILLCDRVGVKDAVAQSYARTRGYWGKICSNMLLVALITSFISSLLNSTFAPLVRPSPVFGIWLHAVIQQLSLAFNTVFLVLLSKTVMEYPVKD